MRDHIWFTSRFSEKASMLNLILLGLAFTTCFLFRAALQYWKFGSNGLSLLKHPSQTLIFFGLVAVFSLQALLVDYEPSKAQINFGLIYYLLGMGLTAWSQFQMGKSWQVGIDPNIKPGLVTHGIYSITRNPIYVALMNILVGYTILLPTALSVVLTVCSFYLIRRQIIKEERYLESVYGDEYIEYKNKVARW